MMKYVDWGWHVDPDEVTIPKSNCRNCGAPVTSKRCDYCGTVYADSEVTMITNELEKPVRCPRCGGVPTIFHDFSILEQERYVFVSCSKCKARTRIEKVCLENMINVYDINPEELAITKILMMDFKNGKFDK